MSHGMGWKPSLPDIRDYRLTFGEGNVEVPISVDLRTTGYLPDIWDQGQLGSCTAHGAGAAYSFDLAKQGVQTNFSPSRLFIYYNSRVIEGTPTEDSGATITDAIKSLNSYGSPVDSDWPYDVSKFTQKPPPKAYTDGGLREAIKYARVNQTVNDMQACLAAGTPIVVGFTVYDSFESDAVAQTGDVPLPSKSESVLGGHCVVVVGYTTRHGQPVWIARNSWGNGWGDAGYFYFPQSYLINTSLSDDFWTVQSVSSPTPTPTPPGPTPTPTPGPTPTPDPKPTPPAPDADHVLWAAVKDWAGAKHIGSTKKAATAVKTWAASKKL